MYRSWFKIDEQEDVLTEIDLCNKGKSSVLIAVDKPIAWHVKNVIDLGLPMTHEQIKIIVHYEREKKFPYDTQYLYNMSNITVAPDCVSYIGFGGFDESVKIINPEKGYREERYLIFTCVPQIKHFVGATEIYIDCNYKVIPQGYHQILSILAYNEHLKQFFRISLCQCHINQKIYIHIYLKAFYLWYMIIIYLSMQKILKYIVNLNIL